MFRLPSNISCAVSRLLAESRGGKATPVSVSATFNGKEYDIELKKSV